jgi:outer membrane protein assembly factor BamB
MLFMREFDATAVACAFFCGFLAVAAHAQPPGGDWPQWRGPARNAHVQGLNAPEIWPDRLTPRWTADAGLGYATPLLVGDRVFLFARQGQAESMTALDAGTGRQLWRTGYEATFTMNSGAARHGPGPKSTPAFSNGRIFSIGMTGVVSAFDAATGKLVWQKPAGDVAPLFTTHAFSPLVEGSLVIFHLGGHDQGALTAFDTATGEERWRWAGDGPAYGSPVIAEIEGTRQLITLTQRRLVSLDAANGTLLWELPYTTPSVTNAQTPNVVGNRVLIGDSGHPIQAFDITRKDGRWTATVAWENTDARLELSTALLVQGTLYGLSVRNAGQYFAIDAKTGKTLWTSPPRQTPQAAIVTGGNLLFSLEADGELVVLRASTTAFEPIARYTVSEHATWAPPVISGNRAFIKDVDTIRLWTWEDAGNEPAAEPVSTPRISPDTLLRADILFWESIRDKTDPALFEAYLRQFPDGTFRVLAEARLRELRGSTEGPQSGMAPGAAAAAPRHLSLEWASIPAGRVQIGCVPGDQECRADEKPRHTLNLAAFQMMTTPVTVAMYRAYAAARDLPMPSQPEWNVRPDHPVVAVSWEQAAAFCRANEARLPTEAEFEYAARGGVDGAIYAWGNGRMPVVQGRKMANVADEAAKRANPGWTDYLVGYDDGFAETSPVASFPPNAFGLFDMAGNVWEWTSSLDVPYPHRANDGRENPSSRERRALRGGSWTTVPRGMRLSYRVMDDPRDEDDNHGFRCVR